MDQRTPLILDLLVDGQRYIYVQDREGTSCGHASASQYTGGCRCDACKDAWAKKARERRALRCS